MMTRRWLACAMLIAAVIAGGGCEAGQSAPPDAALRQAIVEASAAYFSAVAAEDDQAVRAMLSPRTADWLGQHDRGDDLLAAVLGVTRAGSPYRLERPDRDEAGPLARMIDRDGKPMTLRFVVDHRRATIDLLDDLVAWDEYFALADEIRLMQEELMELEHVD
jgi:hypothetical protein